MAGGWDRLIGLTLARPDQPPPDSDHQYAADRKKSDIPSDRAAEVVPDVVQAKYLMVDQSLDEVEEPEPQDQSAKV